MSREREVFDEDWVHRCKDERQGYKQEPFTSRVETIETRDNDHLFNGRSEMKSSKRSRDKRPKMLDNDRVTVDPKVENPDLLYNGKPEGASNGRKHPDYDDEDAMKSTGKVKDEEQIRLKSSVPPPPLYVKLNIPPPYSKPHNVSKSQRVRKKQVSGLWMIGITRMIYLYLNQDHLIKALGTQLGKKNIVTWPVRKKKTKANPLYGKI